MENASEHASDAEKGLRGGDPNDLVTSHVISFDYLLFLCSEVRRLRVFENKVLRRIFGPRRNEVTGDWRRLHNEEINDLYC